MSETDPKTPPRRPRRWRPVLAILLLAGVAAGATVYAARKTLARDALVGWLRDQGIESEVAFQAFDPGGFSGALRVGPAKDPDLTAEVAEVRYDLLGFWNGEPLGARVTEVRLLNPTIHGRWHDGKLSLGSLDPLIEKLRKQPPHKDKAQPKIEVDGATLRLDTDYGPLQAQADIRANDGRLQRLDARILPANLKGAGLEAKLGPGELHVVSFGDRLAIAAAAQVDRGRAAGVAVDGSTLRLTAQAPYPDFQKRSGAGDVTLNLAMDAKALSAGGRKAGGLRQTLNFTGAATGWLTDLGLKGAADLTLDADTADLGGGAARGVQLRAHSQDFAWSRAGGDHVTGNLRLTGAADRVSAGQDLNLTKIAGVFEGPAAVAAKTWRFDMRGGASAHGGWSGLGPVKSADGPGDAALKHALAAFLVDAPRLGVDASDKGLTLVLAAPVRLTPDGGGQVQIVAGDGPLFAKGAGAFRLTSGGGGLPSAELTVPHYVADAGGVHGQARLAAKGSIGPVVEGETDLAGSFRLAGGALDVTADRCVPVSAARLELGVNDVEAIKGEFCPAAGGALVRIGDGGWRAQGAIKDLAAMVPFLETRVVQAAGPVDLGARDGELDLTADIRTARLEDTAKAQRFRPLLAHGTAQLANQVWRGAFALTDPAGRKLADATLDHDGRSGVGGVKLDTGDLTFAEGGLQPAALSPLAASIGAPAQGHARFQGEIDWTATASTSHGVLDIPGLDFQGPTGPVKGLKGQVVLASLAPLRAEPGQTLRADSVSGLAPMKAAEIHFGVDHEAIQVAGARFDVGGGEMRVKPFEIPFAANTPWSAEVELDRVQLADFVEASPFGDRMDLTARVSGHIPFAVDKSGVRVANGELHAVEPGRITIRREALGPVSSSGVTATAEGAKAPAPAQAAAAADPYSDFVYQAMEDLAFTELRAEVNSQAGGRLGILFHIKGEHSPPTRKEINLTWLEVATRKFRRPLDLPSGTKVDLTLDTSTNLDQLLADFADYQRLRGSGPVQP